MKKSGYILLLAIFVLILFPGCESRQTETRTDPTVKGVEPVTPTLEAITGASNTTAPVFEFVKIRRTPPVDFAVLEKLYKEQLQFFVKKADSKFKTTLDADVLGALKMGAEGKNIHGNMQVAEKSIQRAYILFFFDSLKSIASNPKEETAITILYETAPLIQSASQRRSKWANKGSEYEDTFDSFFKAIIFALKENNGEKIGVSTKSMDSFAVKMIVLSVFYELDGLEKSRGKNDNTVAEKIVEARIYYQNILGVHQSRDKDGAATVASQLALPVDQVDVNLVQKILKNAFKSEVADIDPAILGI